MKFEIVVALCYVLMIMTRSGRGIRSTSNIIFAVFFSGWLVVLIVVVHEVGDSSGSTCSS